MANNRRNMKAGVGNAIVSIRRKLASTSSPEARIALYEDLALAQADYEALSVNDDMDMGMDTDFDMDFDEDMGFEDGSEFDMDFDEEIMPDFDDADDMVGGDFSPGIDTGLGFDEDISDDFGSFDDMDMGMDTDFDDFDEDMNPVFANRSRRASRKDAETKTARSSGNRWQSENTQHISYVISKAADIVESIEKRDRVASSKGRKFTAGVSVKDNLISKVSKLMKARRHPQFATEKMAGYIDNIGSDVMKLHTTFVK